MLSHHLLEGNWNLVSRAIASLSLTALDWEVLSTAVTVGPDSLPDIEVCGFLFTSVSVYIYIYVCVSVCMSGKQRDGMGVWVCIVQ